MADEALDSVKPGAAGEAKTTEYPEIGGDESGIVPPQAGRNPEWPKKIRTLTAAELDRLTIDSSGRFYWDGKLVNYETRTTGSNKSDPLAQSMDILDRAAYELGEHKTPAPVSGTALARSGDSGLDHAAALADVLAAQPVIRSTERVRLALTRWQSAALTLIVLGLTLGALGVAASGFVAAHGWSCRSGLIRTGCPAPPPRAPARPDIPA